MNDSSGCFFNLSLLNPIQIGYNSNILSFSSKDIERSMIDNTRVISGKDIHFVAFLATYETKFYNRAVFRTTGRGVNLMVIM
jgi:hypothetical protein